MCSGLIKDAFCQVCGWEGPGVKEAPVGDKNKVTYACPTCLIILNLLSQNKSVVGDLELTQFVHLVRVIISQSVSLMLAETISVVDTNLKNFIRGILEDRDIDQEERIDRLNKFKIEPN